MAKNIEIFRKNIRTYFLAARTESPRGFVLLSTGLIEEQLKELLLALMVERKETSALFEGGNAPLGNLSARADVAFALGLINEEEHYNLTLLRKIRNDFAHKISTTFGTSSVKSRCKELKGKAWSSEPITPLKQFQHAAWRLLMDLTQRPSHVSKIRCAVGDWPTFEPLPFEYNE